MALDRKWKYSVAERGSNGVRALEAAWESLRGVQPEIPAAVLTFVDTRSRRRVRGYFAKSVWKKRRNSAHEIGVSPTLIGDPKGMVATMLHEAAHAVLWEVGKAGGIGSTPYYHTKVFRDQAQAFGLACEFLNTRYGWTLTSWPSNRIPVHYRSVIALIRAEMPAGLKNKRTSVSVKGRKLPPSGHTLLECDCADRNRSVYVKKSILEAGGVMCDYCGSEFRPRRTTCA